MQGASLLWAQLKDASLRGAQLQGAVLVWAYLEGAWLYSAQLQGALLSSAKLQGATLIKAELQGASLGSAQLQGARLDEAQLQGASLFSAQLQGASIAKAQLQGALLEGAQLQGASLVDAQLQGAVLGGAELQGASLRGARIWRLRGRPPSSLALVNLENFEPLARPWNGGDDSFSNWRAKIVASIALGFQRDSVAERSPDLVVHRHLAGLLASKGVERVNALDPAPDKKAENVLDSAFWEYIQSSQPQGEKRERDIAGFLMDLACRNDDAPYLARGLLKNGRIAAAGSQVGAIADKLRKGRVDQSACPGVKGFTDSDWAAIDKLVAAAPKPTDPPKPP